MSGLESKPGLERELHPLFAGAIAGDKRAYEDLLIRVGALARGYVYRKLGGDGDGEDVAQEILISVHRALHTYDPSRPCMPWLAAIMHYRLNDWLRKYYRSARHKKVALDEIVSFLAAPVTGTPAANEHLDNEHLDNAMQTLSPRQKAVINAMYHEDLSVRETSGKLGMSVSAVKVTAHRAYRKLRQRMEGA